MDSVRVRHGIRTVCAPKPSSTIEKKEKKTSTTIKKTPTAERIKEKASTTEKKTSTKDRITSIKDIKEKPKAKPKRIGFLTALALASNISPDLALSFLPKAYKALKKRYESGKAHFKVNGKDGKLRDAKDGEAVRVDLSKPETYAIIERNKKDPKENEAIVAHPMLLSYNPPDPEDIDHDTPAVAAHSPKNRYQWDQNGNTASTDGYYQQAQQSYTGENSYYQQNTGDANTQQNPYNVQSSYKVQSSYDTPKIAYSPHDIYGGSSTQNVNYSQSGIYTAPSTQNVKYTTYEVPSTDHKPYYPYEIPRSRAITEVTLWPGSKEQLPDGSWMDVYHIPYAFAEDSTFCKSIAQTGADLYQVLRCSDEHLSAQMLRNRSISNAKMLRPISEHLGLYQKCTDAQTHMLRCSENHIF
ncbi:hypothetical protein DdX_13201 [Ditylenchus destructor]|uniref:Uncharacterized protein n=1 Tax=Ditylenchus destructor TaxID=166010 RepID=A0AAD4MV22_9BILA|nr:hypothetical protein DdX_13201 [Ditylenchus destructor]